MDTPEKTFPTRTVFPTHPDQPGLTHNVIFGHKAPIAAILRTMTVITHHPVIVHFKSIAGSFLSVDKYFAIALLPVIVFINHDGALVECYVLPVQLDAGAF